MMESEDPAASTSFSGCTAIEQIGPSFCPKNPSWYLITFMVSPPGLCREMCEDPVAITGAAGCKHIAVIGSLCALNVTVLFCALMSHTLKSPLAAPLRSCEGRRQSQCVYSKQHCESTTTRGHRHKHTHSLKSCVGRRQSMFLYCKQHCESATAQGHRHKYTHSQASILIKYSSDSPSELGQVCVTAHK